MTKDTVILELLIIQILVVLSLIFLIIYIISLRRTYMLDKKFSKYTVKSLKEDDKSISIALTSALILLVKSISSVIKNIKIFNSYGILYEKHISFDNRKKIDGIDFVSMKLLSSLFVLLIFLISHIFSYTKISLLGSILAFIIGFFIPDMFIQYKYNLMKKEISEDLLKAIIMMNNSFKSGKSINQALKGVSNELEGTLSSEFKKILLDLEFGLNIETAFNRFYERVKLEDIKFISSTLSVLSKTGGNIVKIFTSVEKEFYDRKRLEEELKSMTASSNLVFKFLLIIPFLLIIAVYLLSPTFFEPIFKTPIGNIVFAIVIVLYSLYVLVIRKILGIEV